MMLTTVLAVAFLAADALAHGDHADQVPIAGPHKSIWYNTLPGDGGTQVCQLIDTSIL
jgi:agmatinase